MANNHPRQRRNTHRPAPPAARTRAPQPRGGRRPAPAAPANRGFRGGIERLSLPLITALHGAPRWLVGAVPGVLLLAGLLLPAPWGPALLAIVALFIVWLLALSWPRLDGKSRVLRAGIVLLLVGAVAARAVGWL